MKKSVRDNLAVNALKVMGVGVALVEIIRRNDEHEAAIIDYNDKFVDHATFGCFHGHKDFTDKIVSSVIKDEISDIPEDGFKINRFFCGDTKYLDINLKPVDKDIWMIITADVSDIISNGKAKPVTEDINLDFVIENTENLIWFLKDKATFGRVNNNFAGFFNMSPDYIQNCEIALSLPKQAVRELSRLNAKIWESKESIEKEIFLFDFFGENRLLKVKATPKVDANGEIEMVVCNAIDITEQKRNEEDLRNLVVALKLSIKMTEDRVDEIQELYTRLQESERELIKLNSSKDKFFSILAHDLRNPFQSLFGASKLLKDEIHKISRQEILEMTNDMHDSIQSVYKLLENLLNWSRIQRGALKVYPENIYASFLIKQNIILLKDLATKKSISLVNEVPEMLQVHSDVNVLDTAIRNLLSNAIKFTNHGGYVKFSAEEHSEAIVLNVIDNGVGMSSETLNSLFKIDECRTSKGTDDEAGTGLGLIICKELVELSGGKIEVVSNQGVGTKFRIILSKAVEETE